MSSFQRILSFVPPILLFVFPAFSQIQGKLEQLPGTETYQVSIIPTMDVNLPLSATSSAQITLRANSAKLDLINFQSITGDWQMQNQYVAPVEAPSHDYFQFFMINPLPTIEYITGSEIILFTFENNNPCTRVELVDNVSDPFVSNNTLSVNAENYFSTLMGNIYEGNDNSSFVDCPSLGLTISAVDNPLKCHGDATSLTVKAIKGEAPYTVVYKHATTGVTSTTVIPVFEGTATFNAVPAGNYLFTITDIKDSTELTNYDLLQPNPLKVELEPFPATCSGSKDGAVRIQSVSGLNGPDINAYQYFWDVDPANSNIEIDSLYTGDYSVTVIDANGCQTEKSIFVDVFNHLFITEDIIPISCYGETDGIIDITPLGLTPPYKYFWSPNANTGNESAAWMLGSGEYHVTVTDEAEICAQTKVFFIEEPQQIEVDYQMIEPECYGDEAFLKILAVENAQGAFNIELTGRHTQLTDFDFEVDAGVPLNLAVVDSKGCEVSEDFIIPDRQEMYIDLGEDKTIKYGEEVYIDSEVFPLFDVDLEWTPSLWLDCLDCPDPTAAPLETITYQLRMTGSTGCVVEDQINITVNKSRDIYIPSAFSPNQDGINDIFRPYGGFEIVQVKSLMVFDRWGGLIYNRQKAFTLEDKEIGWDGTSNGKPLDPGAYLYTMNVEFIDGEIILFAGDINLMK